MRRVRSVAAWILVAAGGAAAGGLALPRTGLCGNYYTNLERRGPPIAVHIDQSLSTDTLDNGTPGVWPVFAVDWTGFIVINRTGTYQFATLSDDGSEIEIDGRIVVENGGQHGPQESHGAATLEAGMHPITIRYEQDGGGFALAVNYAPPGGQLTTLPASVLTPDQISYSNYRQREAMPIVAAIIAVLLWVAVARVCARRGPPSWLTAPPWPALDRPAVAITTIVVVAVAMRIFMMLGSNAILWGDSDVFIESFGAIRNGRFFEHDPFRTLLYPYFLTAFLIWSGEPPMDQILIGAQHVLGVVSAVCFYLAGRAAFGSRVALAGGLLFSIHTTQLFYENSVLSESFFVCLLSISLVLLTRYVDAPTVRRSIAAGAACVVLTMTRPVAEYFVMIPLALALMSFASWRARFAGAAVIVAIYAAVMVPWAEYNKKEFGFFGVAVGQGLGLFIRTFEIERFDLPADTQYPEVQQVLTYARATQYSPATFVRDELRRRHYSVAQADDLMYRASIEAVARHPIVFAINSVKQWWLLLHGPLGDESICNGPQGPYVCTKRTIGYAREPFLNRPRHEHEPVRPWVVAYFRHFQLPITLFSAFAIFGAIAYAASPARAGSGVLLALTAAYFTLLPAVAQSPQDRYRIPVDGLLLILGCFGVLKLAKELFRLE